MAKFRSTRPMALNLFVNCAAAALCRRDIGCGTTMVIQVRLSRTGDTQMFRGVYAARGRSDACLSTITPKHEGKLWTTYQLPGALHDWTVGGGVSVQSATYVTGSALTYDAAGNPTGTNTHFAYSQAGYTLYDAMARYRVNEHWDVTFNGNNLFDKHYYRTVSSSANGNYYGEPRNFMVTLRGQY